MSSSIIWIVIILLTGFGFYSFILWKRAKQHSRFQSRLSIIFFLFALIPIIPLAILLSLLLTKSTEILMLPGVEQALSSSVDVIRQQLDERGKSFLNACPDIRSVTDTQMRQARMSYIGEINRSSGRITIAYFKSIHPQITKAPRTLQMSEMEKIKTRTPEGALVDDQSLHLYESYKAINDSTLCFAGFELPPSVARARNDISWALRNYA